jgi:hypothetical protein
VRAECGRDPALDTGGGTSDARFVARHCPVAELGALCRERGVLFHTDAVQWFVRTRGLQPRDRAHTTRLTTATPKRTRAASPMCTQ